MLQQLILCQLDFKSRCERWLVTSSLWSLKMISSWSSFVSFLSFFTRLTSGTTLASGGWGVPCQPVDKQEQWHVNSFKGNKIYLIYNIYAPILWTESAGPCSKMEWDWMVWGFSLLLLPLVSLFFSSLSLLSFFGTMTSSFNLKKTSLIAADW